MGIFTEEECGLRTKRLGVQNTVLSISQSVYLNGSNGEEAGEKILKDKGNLSDIQLLGTLYMIR